MHLDDPTYIALSNNGKFKCIKQYIKRINDEIDDTRQRLHILKKKKSTYKDALQALKQSLPAGQLKTNVDAKITDVTNEQIDLDTHLW